jgi:aryl-alcohol dehydrogenase (NADP+)
MARIGGSEFDVFPLCFGGNVLGWTADTAASHAILDAFTAGGGNFIDTADAYSQWVPGNAGGVSESVLGGWMAKRGNRERLIVATKVGSKRDRAGLAPANIRLACDESLARLQTDRIDLYYCHRDDPTTPLADTLGALTDLVKAGKVRYIAASNYSAPRLREALDASAAHGYARFVAFQPHYNLLARHEYEGALADLCAREGLSCFPYYALAAGFLTGKYRSPEAAKGAAREARVSGYIDERAWRVLAALDAVAARRGTSDATVALAWLLAQPTVLAPIASASRVAQVEGLLAAARLRLEPQDLAELDAASRRGAR